MITRCYREESSLTESLDEQGELKEYVGCKIERDEHQIRMTQPVMIQSFQDEFDLPGNKPPNPAKAGETLAREDGSASLTDTKQTIYRSGVGKMIHMMRFSRNDVLNRVRELTRFMSAATETHLDRMYRVMEYVVTTKDVGNIIRPNKKWNGARNSLKFDFEVITDSELSSKPEERHSVGGTTIKMCGAVISAKSKMHKTTVLSITEGEFVAGCDGVQDALLSIQAIENMDLQVDYPIVWRTDNKGAVDLLNSWSATGRTRHIANKITWMRELKEAGKLRGVWIPAKEMYSDILTKNVGGSDYQRHSTQYVG